MEGGQQIEEFKMRKAGRHEWGHYSDSHFEWEEEGGRSAG